MNSNEQLKDNVHKFMICSRGRKSDNMDSTGVGGERGVGERKKREEREKKERKESRTAEVSTVAAN